MLVRLVVFIRYNTNILDDCFDQNVSMFNFTDELFIYFHELKILLENLK